MPERYRTIVADPPWPFKWHGGPGGRRASTTELGYDTMTVVEIGELFAPPFPWADDAVIFLWTTQEALHRGDARYIAQMWGFPDRVGEFVWRKPNFGAGAFPRIGHETCVIYKRGAGSLKPDARRDFHSVQTWAQRYDTNAGKTHSAKPDGFYDAIYEAHQGPFLEMFARRARFDWEYWGDQSLGTAELGEAA